MGVRQCRPLRPTTTGWSNSTKGNTIDTVEFCDTPAKKPIGTVAALATSLGLKPKFLWLMYRHADKHYRTLQIPKGNGKTRTVHDPSKNLKFLQKRIARSFLRRDYGPQVGAYVRGRSCRDTAVQHAGSALIISMDIENFFDSTPQWRVHAALRATRTTVTLEGQAASALAAICCLDRRVPQGAPTSGDICNLVASVYVDPVIGKVLRSLPGSMVKTAKNQADTDEGVRSLVFPDDAKFVYTRYSDDIDISCNVELPRTHVDYIIHKVGRILKDAGYSVNKQKTKVERRGGRQIVLGMVVNEHPNVPRTKYNKYRAMIHNCLETGFDAQAERAGFTTGAQLYTHLSGMVSYMGQVNPNKRDKLVPVLQAAKEKYANQLV